jgi:hypothetical protein
MSPQNAAQAPHETAAACTIIPSKSPQATTMETLKSQIVTSKVELPSERVERRILSIRGQKVMLDSDLAALYEVETKTLNQAVKRNLERFPQDFMFQLTPEEADAVREFSDSEVLRSQFVTSKDARGGRRYQPLVFT